MQYTFMRLAPYNHYQGTSVSFLSLYRRPIGNVDIKYKCSQITEVNPLFSYYRLKLYLRHDNRTRHNRRHTPHATRHYRRLIILLPNRYSILDLNIEILHPLLLHQAGGRQTSIFPTTIIIDLGRNGICKTLYIITSSIRSL